MYGIATDRSRRALFTAGAAAHLARRLACNARNNPLLAPDISAFADNLVECAEATERVSTALARGMLLEDTTCDLVLTTLARLNIKSWQQAGGDAFVTQYLISDAVEQGLIDHFRRGSSAWRVDGDHGDAGAEAESTLRAEEVARVACALTGNSPTLAIHALIGLAIQALCQAP